MELPQGSSGQGDAVRVMDESVQNRIAKCGVADQVMPVIDGDLARNERRPAPGAILDDLQEIASLAVPQGSKPPIVQHEDARLRELLQQFAPGAIGAREGEVAEQARHPRIADEVPLPARGLPKRTG